MGQYLTAAPPRCQVVRHRTRATRDRSGRTRASGEPQPQRGCETVAASRRAQARQRRPRGPWPGRDASSASAALPRAGGFIPRGPAGWAGRGRARARIPAQAAALSARHGRRCRAGARRPGGAAPARGRASPAPNPPAPVVTLDPPVTLRHVAGGGSALVRTAARNSSTGTRISRQICRRRMGCHDTSGPRRGADLRGEGSGGLDASGQRRRRRDRPVR